MNKGKIQEKPYQLLVVERNRSELDQIYLDDAKAFFAPIEQKGILRVTYASTLVEAEKVLKEGSIDMTITGIFFPTGLEGMEHGRFLDVLTAELEFYTSGRSDVREAARRWQCGLTDPPSGVYVAKQCIDREGYMRRFRGVKIPVVFNTDSYHHDGAIEPVHYWAKSPKDVRRDIVQMVEAGNEKGKAYAKDWEIAYMRVVRELMSLKSGGEFVSLDTNFTRKYIENLRRYLENPEDCPLYLGLKTKEDIENEIEATKVKLEKAKETRKEVGLE